MDVAAWLRELGLERYAHAFQENKIDADLLPKLTADDLKDPGGSLVGHQRRLLDEIALLAETEALSERMRWVAPPFGAKRRRLTVMFADLVGSATLWARLEPGRAFVRTLACQSSERWRERPTEPA